VPRGCWRPLVALLGCWMHPCEQPGSSNRGLEQMGRLQLTPQLAREKECRLSLAALYWEALLQIVAVGLSNRLRSGFHLCQIKANVFIRYSVGLRLTK
jgi:hypothetical protein